MDASIFLARALGIYLVVVCLLMLSKRKFFQQAIQSFTDSKALILLSSFFSLIIGILVVVSHNIWVCNWRVIITVIGWLALLKGVLLILAPYKLTSWSLKASRSITPVVCVLATILGAYLIYIGFFIA